MLGLHLQCHWAALGLCRPPSALAPSCRAVQVPHVLYKKERLRHILVRAGLDDDPYVNLFKSKVFQSDLVVKEFDSLMSELRGLSMMLSKFPDMDLAGKKMFVERMADSTGRYRLFMKRLELAGAEDPAAADYLRYTNAQMLEGGFSLTGMFAGLEQGLEQYRTWVEAEEKASVDPVKHQEFLAHMRGAWSASAIGRVDMSYLSRVADPATIMRAQRDPEFYKAIKEISDSTNPNEAISRWLDHPNIGPLVGAMWKAMQQQR